MNVVIDLESIPGASQYAQDEYEAYCETIHPPGNYKKPETIAKWMDENAPALREEYRHKQGLSAATGQIITIGIKVDGSPVECGTVRDSSEGDMLQSFIDEIDMYIGRPMFIGHNIIQFDLPYIWRRCKILGVATPSWLPSPADLKPWSDNVFDTMVAWSGPRDRISLDRLCRIFGIDGKDGMDGSDVWEYYKAGRLEEIEAYCASDVEKTWRVYEALK